MSNNTEKYKSIQAWGRMMASFPYYIRDQVTLAIQSNAPEGATYRKEDGTWSTLSDITSEHTIWYFKTNHPELFNKFMNKETI